ncbi:proteasome complex subunit Rpn13 ubiquitin receptor-domain-containing protein [Pseudomassariella vexata]|uniref:Proteasome complex subunit Rpn13 ubiquitin receptor-domain-containing protein n=1 Tax=Pseudomassariella vexata TaxID=1141098 RepID=A0A1Y2E473_9PEZI|nr:proteasome complex subunit Rpn13 ubiquitin receptor-domain-containing protein [Pseudomassariella vexata]ORY66358.1 proteasome complex subunit Rpn13 ubiquitin receptor-domain-containing protein [Pseudomassariella vexata]
MSISPIITFKAGRCELQQSESKPYKVTPQPEPGYIYLYSEDDLIHFCWRERNEPLDSPTLDLVMVPTDGHFVPYELPGANTKTNGRIFVLKFMSSSQRHLFWMQSKPQGRSGDPSWFSPRDRKIGQIIHSLLQGEEVDVQSELRTVNNTDNDDSRRDDDETMEDVEGHGDSNNPHGGAAGGAGPGATGGDVREEGEVAREGGADGARAASSGVDAATAVRNFLNSLEGGAGAGASQGEGKLYPLLSDLLTPATTIPMAMQATVDQIDNLLSFLPPAVLILAQQADSEDASTEPTPDAVEAAKQAMSIGQKKALLEKVLRSPQFHQSLTSLTMALRDGGLPSVADALSIKVDNGGYLKGSSMPLGGGEAVEAFIQGVKKTVQEKK